MTEEQFVAKYIQPAVEELARKAVLQEPLTEIEAQIFVSCGITQVGDYHLLKSK